MAEQQTRVPVTVTNAVRGAIVVYDGRVGVGHDRDQAKKWLKLGEQYEVQDATRNVTSTGDLYLQFNSDEHPRLAGLWFYAGLFAFVSSTALPGPARDGIEPGNEVPAITLVDEQGHDLSTRFYCSLKCQREAEAKIPLTKHRCTYTGYPSNPIFCHNCECRITRPRPQMTYAEWLKRYNYKPETEYPLTFRKDTMPNQAYIDLNRLKDYHVTADVGNVVQITRNTISIGEDMSTFEIVLDGFNGGTDKTDHQILWVNAPGREAIGKLLSDYRLSSHDVHVIDPHTFESGVDYIIDAEGKVVSESPKHSAKLPVSPGSPGIGDVSVNNVLFVDRSVRPQMKGGTHDLKELLSSSVQKTFDPKRATPICIADFIKDILPTATSMDVLLQNKHLGNFVSLTGGDGPERLFRWDNNFAWSYDGEVTDSVKQRVKAAGGNVNALMRVSLSWSNYDDLDLHCVTPRHAHIHFADKMGILDVDMNAGGRRDSRSPVENLAFMQIEDGKYTISVNNYRKMESVDTGFMVEVEFGGVIHQFSHTAIRDKQTVQALEIIVRNRQIVEIKPGVGMTGGSTPTEKWGVKTENLIPVSVMLNSPNHWDGQSVGAKHWFFMLKGCKNPDPVRGIYNEFLRPEFEKHRKVFETLGAKTKCQPSDDQISGVGFTAARNDSVTVVVNGSRAYNITF